MDSSLPWQWKIRCPVGGEEYPSNDFAHGDMTSGPFPDDGIGGGCLHEGKKYGFIAELCQFYCRRMMIGGPGLCATLRGVRRREIRSQGPGRPVPAWLPSMPIWRR